VTRVVELLKDMSLRVEKDRKTEEDLYENFVCWATSITSQKTKTNAAAQSRVDQLTTYITDLNAGRIDLTSERVDLEKEIDELSTAIETADQMRQQEKKDFEQAEKDMEDALSALTDAIGVLGTATENHKTGVLMSVKGGVAETQAVRAKQAARLQRAIDLGRHVLTKGDEVFLQRLLSGDVPKRESWKKLNRKATFKMKYKARSFKIQDTLSKLLVTFTSDLADARAKEQASVDQHAKLMQAKGGEKAAAEEALQKMEKEMGARGVSLEESTAEKQALETQISNDEGYIKQVETTLAEKKAEYQARQTLRMKENAAISKAIEILHSDDSRDLFKKSFASQGYDFLQLSHGQTARQVLRATARRSGDARVAALVRLAGPDHFKEVIDAIDSMLADLKAEENSDLSTKEDCEKTRAEDTRSAIDLSRSMDELTETANALTARVAELTAEIEDKQAQVAAIDKELIEAKDDRDKEHAEYLVSKRDDEDAAVLVDNAKDVLERFYTDNNLMFAQVRSHEPGFQSVAGEAPPPPPRTWEAPRYGGKTEESTGILAILKMITEDILADVEKAKAGEGASLQLYIKTKQNLEGEKRKLGTAINDLTIDRSAAQGDIQDAVKDRTGKNGELTIVMKRIAHIKPHCDFFLINYSVRRNNRHLEIDGLDKAKAILSGGVFDELPDPDREMNPGDAFLQAHIADGRKFLQRRA